MADNTTIIEIAKRLRVSPSTVSRALHDHPRINKSTKERIQETARSMNYERNSQAVFFKQQRTHTIGVILPNIKEEFFSEAISGIEEIAAGYDYTILFGQSHDDPEREKKVIMAMKRQRVDGIIISLSKLSTKIDYQKEIEASGIPIIYFDRVPERNDVNKVYCSMINSTIDLINCLFSRGYKKIAMINGPDSLNASSERVEGFKMAHIAKKIKIDMRYVENCDLTEASTNEAMSRLLSLKKTPDAIISFNDYVHMYATRYAHQNGVRINENIAFVSYSNLNITYYTSFPPLISVEQFPKVQGERAMEIIIQLLEQKNKGELAGIPQYLHRDVPSKIIVHTDTGCA
jgi:DNA-binding LacI/PurR family transcriptional regulator